MAFFDGIPCPVCGKPFLAEDDVVVCPDCGTPHHRSCWKQDNHCVNASKHAEGYQYERPGAVKLTTETETHPQAEPQVPAAPSSGIQCPGCGNVYDNTCTFCPQCGLRSQQPVPPPNLPPQMAAPSFYAVPPAYAQQEDTKIDGETLADIAQAVGPNVQRYIPIFVKQEQQKKKPGWNWASFLFGGYWFLSRKCYPAGLLALIVQLAITIPFNVLLYPHMTAFYQAMNNSGSYANYFSPEMTALSQKMMPYLLLMGGLVLLLHILTGLFGDYLYKKRVIQIVKEERAAFETAKLTSPVAITYGNVQLSPHDVYYAMLSRRGGTNFFAAAGGIFFYEIAGSLILSLFVS